MKPTTTAVAIVASTLFARATAAQEDFFEIEVAGNRAVVFRPLKNGKRREKYYVKRGNFFRCTGYATKGDAGNAARRLLKAHLDKRLDVLEITKLRKEKAWATVGELVQAYEERVRTFALKKIEEESVKHNVNSLRLVVRRVHFPKDEESRKLTREERAARNAKVDALSSTVLTGELVAQFRALHVASAGGDRIERDRRINGVIATMAAARSLFSEQGTLCYADGAGGAGLRVPDMAGFLKEPLPEKPARVMKHFDQAEMAKMAKASRHWREEDANVYLVHLCFRHLGMRNIEIRKARVGWIARRCDTARVMTTAANGQVELLSRPIAGFMEIVKRADFDPKRTSGLVPIDATVLAEIDELTKGRKAEDYLIAPDATETERENIVNRRHGERVRPWFEDFDKNGYELRRWAGTKILELTGSSEMAGRFLRHKPPKDMKVFVGSYATKLPPPPPITFRDVGL